jgi:diguanylate cyclase (GGDEF)-like protein/PAS domain S-box-containing protein
MWTHADAALDSMGDAVLCTDAEARVAYLNHAAEALTGWPRAVASGRPVRDVLRIVNGDTQQPVPDPSGLAVERGETIELAPNCALIQRDGREVPIEGSAAPIHDGNGRVVGTVVTVRDVGAVLEKLQELLHRARHDALTRLPNRSLLNDSLATAIAFARRHRKALAVGFLDVDGLKAVNDLHGHGAGDRVLSGVASRIRATLRQSDSVGRVGGDEFVIVLSEIAHAGDAAFVADKLLQAIAAPYKVAGRDVSVTASLGLALYPDDGVTAEDLVANADAAMYAAKRNGRGECRFFETGMTFVPTERLASVQRRPSRVARQASGSEADA